MNYKTIIGLEIHVELLTHTKIFCGCKNEFKGKPNTHCCPVCLGFPGTLPVLNKKVLEYGIMAGLALQCNISKKTKMDRKNYFYPDLPKGYQISQYDKPLCENGYIEIQEENERKKIRIRRIHIEEDAGKSLHHKREHTLLDYNRSGIPLIEIVTEPDMNSSQEAYEFLEKLKEILLYIKVSDVKMEQGSLRCDININVEREDGAKSKIVELKNLNSFKAVVKAIEYEEKRHQYLLEKGKDTIRETRRFNDKENKTISMRKKEDVQDYRYFLEGDMLQIELKEDFIKKIKENLPELPAKKRKRFIKNYSLSEYEAKVLTSNIEIAAYFEAVIKHFNEPKMVSSWMSTELLRRLKEKNRSIKEMKFTIMDFVYLLKAISKGKINNTAGKKIFKIMFEKGEDPDNILKKENLIQIQNENSIKEMVVHMVEENVQSVIDYKKGKERALGFLIGQVMKESKGKANPQIVRKLIIEKLQNM